MTLYAGKVALITGGSSGIGLAVAQAWVKGGGRAALVARTVMDKRGARNKAAYKLRKQV